MLPRTGPRMRPHVILLKPVQDRISSPWEPRPSEGRVTHVKAEDHVAFEQFYAEHWRPVVGLLISIGGSQAEAEEVAQEAFLRAIPRWRRLRHYDDPGGWLRLVASRILISNHRKATTGRRAMQLMGADQHSPGPTPAAVDLEAALTFLTPSQRAVVLLYYVHDLPVDEVARGLHLPPGTVKSQLARARARLQPLLAGYQVNLDS